MIDRSYNLSFTNFWLNVNSLIETLLEDFKPRALDLLFEYRQINETCKHRNFRPIMKILLLVQKSGNFNSNTSLQLKLSIKTLIEEVKSIVIEEYEAENWDVSKRISFVGHFGLSKFRKNDQNPWFFSWKVVKNRSVDWDLDRRSQAKSYWGIWTCISKYIKINSSFPLSGFWRKEQNRLIVFWKVILKWRALVWTLDAKSEAGELWDCKSTSNYYNIFRVVRSVCQYSEAKKYIFLKFSPPMEICLWRPLQKEWNR